MSSSGKLTALTEYALISADERGLAFDHVFSNHRLRGWLIILNSQLYSMVADDGDDSFAFYVLNGIVGPNAQVLDGIMTSVGGIRSATQYSAPMMMERVGEIEGGEADAAWLDAAMTQWGPVDLASLAPDIRAALTRDHGAAAAADGDATLRIPHERSLARGRF